jgi:hypothetical protein
VLPWWARVELNTIFPRIDGGCRTGAVVVVVVAVVVGVVLGTVVGGPPPCGLAVVVVELVAGLACVVVVDSVDGVAGPDVLDVLDGSIAGAGMKPPPVSPEPF